MSSSKKIKGMQQSFTLSLQGMKPKTIRKPKCRMLRNVIMLSDDDIIIEICFRQSMLAGVGLHMPILGFDCFYNTVSNGGFKCVRLS